MAVTADLRAIAERTERELDSVHDFFEHSRVVWRSFQIHVDQGHKMSVENPATGTLIDQDGLVRLTPPYIREHPATFTFRQTVINRTKSSANANYRRLAAMPRPTSISN